MSDIADIAYHVIAAAVRRGLATVRRQGWLMADCHCHYCDEALAPGVLFCNVDCRDDYDKEQAATARAGRAE